MTHEAVIDEFLESVRVVSEQLTRQFHSAYAGQGLAALLREARVNPESKEGQMVSGLAYKVHGAGSRFIMEDQSVVDLELDRTAQHVVWDAWRVRLFAQSIGQDIELPVVEQELRARVERGQLFEASDGWFGISE